MKLTSCNTPLEIYHGVPSGWSKPEILIAYKQLGGQSILGVTEITEPGAPDWLPDRYSWLQYRGIINELPNLIRENDHPATELAIRYIELNYFGSYSGFLRERLARALKHVEMTQEQQERLLLHFQKLKSIKQCFQEFREYKKLTKHIMIKRLHSNGN